MDKRLKQFAKQTDKSLKQLAKLMDKRLKQFAKQTDKSLKQLAKLMDKRLKQLAKQTDEHLKELAKQMDKHLKQFAKQMEKRLKSLAREEFYSTSPFEVDDLYSSATKRNWTHYPFIAALKTPSGQAKGGNWD